MKIRSAVPENGCLVFFWLTEKKTKQKKQKNTSVKHIRIRLVGGCIKTGLKGHIQFYLCFFSLDNLHSCYDIGKEWLMNREHFTSIPYLERPIPPVEWFFVYCLLQKDIRQRKSHMTQLGVCFELKDKV